MPNWCSASYAIEGDAEEVKSLYKLMKRLQEQKEPSVPNGFGKTWLGCLVNALGGDYNKIHCRGDWSNLEMEGNILKFTTETAWSPCDETFELVCEKFPTLCYFYQSEAVSYTHLDVYKRQGYISTDISWIPVAESSVYIYSIPLPFYNFTPLEPVFLTRCV